MAIDTSLALSDRVLASFAAWVGDVAEDVFTVGDVDPVDIGFHVYMRQVQNLVPARDGVPCAIVSRTPGRTESETKRIQWRDCYFPLTVTICEAANQNAAVAPSPWVAKLRDAIKARVAYGTFEALPEFTRAFHDEGVYIDTTIFDQANLRAVTASVVIFCRVLRNL